MKALIYIFLVLALIIVCFIVFSSRFTKNKDEDRIVKTSLYPMQRDFHKYLSENNTKAVDVLIQMLSTNDKYNVHKNHAIMLIKSAVDLTELNRGKMTGDKCLEWLMKNQDDLIVVDNKIMLRDDSISKTPIQYHQPQAEQK